MSYDLAFWRSTERLSPDRAGEIFKALCNGDQSAITPHESIGQFYAELTRKYPEVDDLPESKLENSPWSSAMDVSSAHVIVSISFSQMQRIVPVLSRLADKYELLCYDPQVHQVGMPGDPTPQAEPELDFKAMLRELNAQIAAALTRYGFKPTKHHLSKRSNGFLFRIGLEDVGECYRPCISVESNRFSRWRREHCAVLGEGNCCFAGYVDELLERTRDLREWTWGASTDLSKTAAEIVAYLETWAMPFFARFDDLPGLCAYLQDRDYYDYPYHVRPPDLIDFLLCFSGQEVAEQLGRRTLATNARVQREFPVELEHYRRTRTFTTWPSTATAEEMANATHYSQIRDKLGGPPCEWTQVLVKATVGYGLRLE